MNQSHDAEKRRGWVATTHPLVARGLLFLPSCIHFATHEETVISFRNLSRQLGLEKEKIRGPRHVTDVPIG